MNQGATVSIRRYTAEKIILWVLLLALLLVLAGIGARHYFREEAVKVGTFPVMIGRVLALWTIALLLIQPVLAIRVRSLDRVFGLDRLLRFHRFSGIACLVMAFFHPMLMYVSGLKKLGPLSADQWPEAIGGFCIVSLWLTVVASVGRRFVNLSYDQWFILHRFTAPLALLALVHMFIIEAVMRSGWLLGFWVVVLSLWAGVLIAVKVVLPAQRARDEAFVVSSAGAVGDNIWQISLKPAADRERFSFVPGQFAFLSFDNPAVANEEHPFTIASAPADHESLQFMIKGCGDWTRNLGAVRPGDKARVSGPFGVFSSSRHEFNRLVLIAGGIGITPMLSTLRQLNHEKSALPVTLIWTYRNSGEAPCLAEIESFRSNLPGLEVKKIVTREQAANAREPNRLDRQALGNMVPAFVEGTFVMLCGPVGMMNDVRRSLLALGYPASAVLSEEFAL